MHFSVFAPKSLCTQLYILCLYNVSSQLVAHQNPLHWFYTYNIYVNMTGHKRTLQDLIKPQHYSYSHVLAFIHFKRHRTEPDIFFKIYIFIKKYIFFFFFLGIESLKYQVAAYNVNLFKYINLDHIHIHRTLCVLYIFFHFFLPFFCIFTLVGLFTVSCLNVLL